MNKIPQLEQLQDELEDRRDYLVQEALSNVTNRVEQVEIVMECVQGYIRLVDELPDFDKHLDKLITDIRVRYLNHLQ